MPGVALRKESVDRKKSYLHCVSTPPVALRKESVDRKVARAGAPSANGAVALRKESVDRKTDKRHPEVLELGRSPQGERG